MFKTAANLHFAAAGVPARLCDNGLAVLGRSKYGIRHIAVRLQEFELFLQRHIRRTQVIRQRGGIRLDNALLCDDLLMYELGLDFRRLGRLDFVIQPRQEFGIAACVVVSRLADFAFGIHGPVVIGVRIERFTLDCLNVLNLKPRALGCVVEVCKFAVFGRQEGILLGRALNVRFNCTAPKCAVAVCTVVEFRETADSVTDCAAALAPVCLSSLRSFHCVGQCLVRLKVVECLFLLSILADLVTGKSYNTLLPILLGFRRRLFTQYGHRASEPHREVKIGASCAVVGVDFTRTINRDFVFECAIRRGNGGQRGRHSLIMRSLLHNPFAALHDERRAALHHNIAFVVNDRLRFGLLEKVPIDAGYRQTLCKHHLLNVSRLNDAALRVRNHRVHVAKLPLLSALSTKNVPFAFGSREILAANVRTPHDIGLRQNGRILRLQFLDLFKGRRVILAVEDNVRHRVRLSVTECTGRETICTDKFGHKRGLHAHIAHLAAAVTARTNTAHRRNQSSNAARSQFLEGLENEIGLNRAILEFRVFEAIAATVCNVTERHIRHNGIIGFIRHG